MHAIIKQKGGSHYVSAVFGYYKNISATDDYQRYLEGIHNPYYVVWDATYTKQVKHLVTNLVYDVIGIVDCKQPIITQYHEKSHLVPGVRNRILPI